MYRSIRAIRQLPGRDEFGNLNTERLIRWILDVRGRCERRGRLGMGDFCIGFLLSNSPEGDDGIWPFEPVRDALEKFTANISARDSPWAATIHSAYIQALEVTRNARLKTGIKNGHREYSTLTRKHPKC